MDRPYVWMVVVATNYARMRAGWLNNCDNCKLKDGNRGVVRVSAAVSTPRSR